MIKTGCIFSPEIAYFALVTYFRARSHYFATLGGVIWILMLALFLKLGRTTARCLVAGRSND